MRGVPVNGAAVHAARVQSGLTQRELAKLARVDPKTVRKAEQGKRLDLIPLTRLAEALNTDLKALIVPGDVEPESQVSWRDIVLQWARAFDDHDAVRLLAVYHEEAVLRLPGSPDIPFGGVFRGKEEIRKAHEIVWTTVPQEPVRLDEIIILVSDEGVTLKGAKDVYTPTGEMIRVPVLQIFTFADQLIIEHHVEFDTLDFSKRMQPPT